MTISSITISSIKSSGGHIETKYKLNIFNNNVEMGSISGNGEYKKGEKVEIIAKPNLGYKFDGWFNDAIYTNLLSSDESYSVIIDETDKNIYAKFSTVQYSITYNLNGGNNNVDNPNKYTINDSFEFKEPNRVESQFVEWRDNNGNVIKGINKGTTGNITINANWNINQYNVMVHVNDSSMGLVSGEGKYDYNSNVRITATPNKGYQFDGWYSDSSYLNILSKDKSYTFTMPNENKDIYAKFSLEKYTITYNLNGGINNKDNPISYTILDSITFLEPSKEENKFIEWTDKDGEKIKGISKGSVGNIVVNANWKINQYNVTLHANDYNMGLVSGGGKYDYNSSVTVTATPIDQYEFIGWYSDSKYSNLLTTDKSYTFKLTNENVDLYAKFNNEWAKEHGVIPTINTTDNTITYGLYPQTVVSPINETTLISELEKLTPSTYNYIYYNDEYYAKLDSARLFPKANYKFSDGTTIVDGATYYFKCEPIKWNIISNSYGTYYLDCTNILDSQRYGEDYEETKSKTDYKGETATVYANNYKYSDIRTYLNTTFYKQAFFLNNEYIIDTTVDNSAASTYSETNIYACEDTVDKIFVRSNAELHDESSRTKKPSDFFLANYSQKTSSSGCGFYWMRSPYETNSRYSRYIGGSGIYQYDYVNRFDIGVSPALNISFKYPVID